MELGIFVAAFMCGSFVALLDGPLWAAWALGVIVYVLVYGIWVIEEILKEKL